MQEARARRRRGSAKGGLGPGPAAEPVQGGDRGVRVREGAAPGRAEPEGQGPLGGAGRGGRPGASRVSGREGGGPRPAAGPRALTSAGLGPCSTGPHRCCRRPHARPPPAPAPPWTRRVSQPAPALGPPARNTPPGSAARGAGPGRSNRPRTSRPARGEAGSRRLRARGFASFYGSLGARRAPAVKRAASGAGCGKGKGPAGGAEVSGVRWPARRPGRVPSRLSPQPTALSPRVSPAGRPAPARPPRGSGARARPGARTVRRGEPVRGERDRGWRFTPWRPELSSW